MQPWLNRRVLRNQRPKKKTDSDESHKLKVAQSLAEAKQAKQQLAELSQQLVLSLVKMIETEKMLKPAMSLLPTTSSDTGSGNSGVPDVAPCFQTIYGNIFHLTTIDILCV